MKRPRSVLRDEVHTNTGRESRLPDAEYAKKTISVTAVVKGSHPLETLRDPAGADALILVSTLFAYGIPGALRPRPRSSAAKETCPTLAMLAKGR